MDRTKTRAVLKDRGAARARSGHPWIYRSDVAEAGGEVGDVVPVFGRKGNLLGHALYNPGSEITLRIATRRDEPVDETWFRARIEEALSSRDSFEIDGDAYRLLHAEADGIPDLVVHRYGNYLVLQVGSAAVEKRLDWIVGALADLVSPRGLLLRGDSAARREEGLGSMVRVLYGEWRGSRVRRRSRRLRTVPGGPLERAEDGCFLDQRQNHLAAGRYARGRVLDAFSYAGGFALHAARRAETVEAVDSSGPALEAARATAELNNLENITFTRKNAFDLLRGRSDAGERYDTVIVDPLAFAKTKRQLPKARRAYKEINLRAMKLLNPGGILVTCSCSYHFTRKLMEETLRSAAADTRKSMRVREWRGQAQDHPEILAVPETCYLKCAVLESVG